MPLGWTKPTGGGQPVSHRGMGIRERHLTVSSPRIFPSLSLSLSLQLKHLLSKPAAYDGGARLMLILKLGRSLGEDAAYLGLLAAHLTRLAAVLPPSTNRNTYGDVCC